MRKSWFVLTACAAAAASAVARAQTYQQEVGYTELVSQLTAANQPIPDGSGVLVTQVEAPLYDDDDYFPDTTNSDFSGKTLTPETNPYATSSHATSVGQFFYGNTMSLAPGITNVDLYNANDWLQEEFLNTGTDYLPDHTDARAANHSYIGSFPTSADTLEALHRLDYVIATDDYINVVAENNPNNGGANPLEADSFNAISVGLTIGTAASGTTGNLDDPQGLYVAGRAAPDVVAPMSETSFATPLVSSAAALLVGYADANPALSKGSFVSPRTGLTLQYGETNDVIKAAIMAGADRIVNNPGDSITNYGASPTQNGLDTRYGAGQLDVYNSYQIIAAGRQAPGTIGTYGYDYNPASSDTAVENYTFTGETGVAATLAWNIHIDDSLSATLAHFQLSLFQLNANGGSISLATSDSSIDNTQNIFALGLNPADTYELQVSRNDELGNWDYGLAWDLAPVPEPVGGMAVLVGMMAGRRRRRVGNSNDEIRNSNECSNTQ